MPCSSRGDAVYPHLHLYPHLHPHKSLNTSTPPFKQTRPSLYPDEEVEHPTPPKSCYCTPTPSPIHSALLSTPPRLFPNTPAEDEKRFWDELMKQYISPAAASGLSTIEQERYRNALCGEIMCVCGCEVRLCSPMRVCCSTPCRLCVRAWKGRLGSASANGYRCRALHSIFFC